MCSLIPKVTFPSLSNEERLIRLLLASNALFKKVDASSPRKVTRQAIGSPSRIANVFTVLWAFRRQGFLPVSWSRTWIAFSSGSPDFPTAIFTVSFSTLISRIGFFSTISAAVSLNFYTMNVRFILAYSVVVGIYPDID